jgi:UDP-N-acetylmuramoylalanine--D-glutamate ligase
MKIAIAGFAVEGESNFRYYSLDPNNKITIADQKKPSQPIPTGVPTIIGEDAFEKLADFDLVVRTASLAPRKIKTNGKIWSSTNEFFSKCPAQIIGVTGTKGKGTICSLLASIFESAGKKTWLLGNIGTAPLDRLVDIQTDDVVIFELSSFQLWDIEKSPHVAVVSLVEPEHLDIHGDFGDYVNAKANIRRYQTADDICVYHPFNVSSRDIANATDKGVRMRYGVSDDGGVYVKDEAFFQQEHKICSTDTLRLIGQHNIENACAAVTVAKLYGVSDDEIRHGLQECNGLPHRLEFVREIDGVKFYDDSYSSSTPATAAAIKSFTSPEVLILGGVDRGGDFEDLAELISNAGNVKAVILVGDIRDKLTELLRNQAHDIKLIKCDDRDMKSIVSLARSQAQVGDVVVLSPGCASFDMFKDFNDRGDQFKKEVNAL